MPSALPAGSPAIVRMPCATVAAAGAIGWDSMLLGLTMHLDGDPSIDRLGVHAGR